MHDFDQYFATRRYQDIDIRPDGSEVVYATDITGSFNAWRQRTSGGWPYQLTAFREHAVRRVAWSPDGTRIALAADRDGDENDQIYVVPAAGGAPVRVTRHDEVRTLLGDRPWCPDGRTLACACNADDDASFDLVLLNVATGAVQRLSRETQFHHACCWSRGGSRLAAIIAHSGVHQDVVIADRETGALSCPTRNRPEARRRPIGFSSDGSALYLLTDEDRAFRGLARLDLVRDTLDWFETPEWDIDLACMSADGRRILYVVNEDSVHRLHLLDRNSGIEPVVPHLPMGYCHAGAIAADGTRAVVLHSASRRPTEVVALDVPAKELRTITHGMVGGIPEADMVEPEVVRYASFDRKIPAHLYRPRGAAGPEGFPALLYIHGGPESQEQPYYHPLYQYLVSRGFVVFAPNIRGSTGYGKAYVKLIRRDFGGDDLRDLEAAARYLGGLPDVDARRIAVGGISYGGFAALGCATRLPRYWAACINVFGASDLVSYVRSVPGAWRRFVRGWVGDPDEEEALLQERSPIRHVDALRCPLLVIQGARDPRVTKADSDRFVEQVRARGGTVEHLVFEDEGHGLLKRENQLRAGHAIAEFLLRHLGARPVGASQ